MKKLNRKWEKMDGEVGWFIKVEGIVRRDGAREHCNIEALQYVAVQDGKVFSEDDC